MIISYGKVRSLKKNQNEFRTIYIEISRLVPSDIPVEKLWTRICKASTVSGTAIQWNAYYSFETLFGEELDDN